VDFDFIQMSKGNLRIYYPFNKMEVFYSMIFRFIFISTSVSLLMFGMQCVQKTEKTELIKQYLISDLNGLVDSVGVTLDSEITADGNGAFRLTTEHPRTFRLYETGDIDIEEARLLYSAKVRTENVDGYAYIELWCRFLGKGEFYSRALQTRLKGNNDWVVQETPFFLKKGENPVNVRLNLVINGSGTVWIDDITILKAPLEQSQ
jgi:hypothetical protein